MRENRQSQTSDDESPGRLRIVHVMRAPIGGLFRHVVDLACAQAARGHAVGLIADSSTGGERAEATLRMLEPSLELGVTRLCMRRLPSWSDPIVAFRIATALKRLSPDVVHGHGAKGGLYARLPALLPMFPTLPHPHVRVYTPHGGSLHYDPDALVNRLYLSVEKALERVTDFIPFESAYAQERFARAIGFSGSVTRVVPNGLRPEEFEPLTPIPDAADFLYVGEWRRFKGVDTLIEALSLIRDATGEAPRLALVGSGPDEAALRACAERLGMSERLSFAPPMPAREALRLGRILVVPSRAESLPYIVLEAIAARMPLIATNVGGIPEIFGEHANRLVESDDPAALARAMIAASGMDEEARRRAAGQLAERVAENFSLTAMVEAVLRGYRDALEAAGHRRAAEAVLPQRA
ncbi:glycosyltransferase involved in cell wall biosynthesis [Methylosinus sp. sav-2]|uniref:glycosyltransferase family 4 protein n=1 Tax=unclassified Methylosinus TaxID=2624500 RepID=UPI000463022A|nr:MULTISPECIES: glycosyltransferase family 4 protein [unclassified Methylosinus]TDX65060.1 glycosyltransferase involved in cell wall biosynthesis [Methylosinus sp. sav-2]